MCLPCVFHLSKDNAEEHVRQRLYRQYRITMPRWGNCLSEQKKKPCSFEISHTYVLDMRQSAVFSRAHTPTEVHLPIDCGTFDCLADCIVRPLPISEICFKETFPTYQSP